MASTLVVGTFVLYLLIVLAIGVWGATNTGNQEDYLLGGRNLNVVWASMSEQASLWSGWLTVGFPGFVYSGGLTGMWWFFWCIPGNMLAWGMVAKRLSRYTRMLKALTLPEFLGKRFRDQYTAVIIIAAIAATYFYFFYVGAQLLAGLATLSAGIGLSRELAFIITFVIVVGYTLVGGYLAVSLTDVMQGILMMVFAIAVPLATIATVGSFDQLITRFNQVADPSMTTWTGGLDGIALWLTIITLVGFGLPFLAQPHGIVRYMSMKKPSSIGFGMMVVAIFQVIAVIGIPILAIGGLLFFPNLANVDNIAPQMIVEVLPPWLSGILLAAIIAAVMSTADSQLLVVGSSVGEDVYKGVINRDASDRKVMLVTRGAVLGAGLVAGAVAWTTPDTVFTAIAFAWGGLGTTFIAPLVAGLWWDRANGPGAVAGLVVGFFGAPIWSNNMLGSGPMIDGIALFDYYFVLPVLVLSTLSLVVVTFLTSPPGADTAQEIREISRPLQEEIGSVSRPGSSPGPAATDGGRPDSGDTGRTEALAIPEEEIVTDFVRQQRLSDLPPA
jgi:sodium/proline symporter